MYITCYIGTRVMSPEDTIRISGETRTEELQDIVNEDEISLFCEDETDDDNTP